MFFRTDVDVNIVFIFDIILNIGMPGEKILVEPFLSPLVAAVRTRPERVRFN